MTEANRLETLLDVVAKLTLAGQFTFFPARIIRETRTYEGGRRSDGFI